nr:UDP-N-acetylmuramate dehydrogenase [Paenalcaligenes hominis]
MLVQSNYQLDSDNTLALASMAQSLVCIDHIDTIPSLQNLVAQFETYRVLGGGSNVVLASVLPGLLIKMQNRGIRLVSQTDTDCIIEAQAGENWHDFVEHCVQNNWLGLENLALIPGTVGAAPVQNIGAYGVELQQFVHQVQVWDFHQASWRYFSAQQCEFAYRDSLFKRAPSGRYVIAAVQFKLCTRATWQPVLRYPDLFNHPELQKDVNARAIFDAVIAVRQHKLPDPRQLANAGSFFKNPVVSKAVYEQIYAQYPAVVAYEQGNQMKLAAGWLIEQAGWKGKRLGPVGMHRRQALVLVNYGGASAIDVHALVQQVQTDVYAMFGVQLEQEPVEMS